MMIMHKNTSLAKSIILTWTLLATSSNTGSLVYFDFYSGVFGLNVNGFSIDVCNFHFHILNVNRGTGRRGLMLREVRKYIEKCPRENSIHQVRRTTRRRVPTSPAAIPEFFTVEPLGYICMYPKQNPSGPEPFAHYRTTSVYRAEQEVYLPYPYPYVEPLL